MAIQRTTHVPQNRIYVPKYKINRGQYDSSEMRATLEYFTIINKIINYKDNNIIKEKENSIFRIEPISSRAINIGSHSELYRVKSFFENASFFLSNLKDAVMTVNINLKVYEINECDDPLIARIYKDELFNRYLDYKYANDEFDRLQDEKTQKIKQLNNLIIELNNFRQFILDEYNPIVLELLDLLEEDESKIKIEYMNFLGKLYQKINYSFKSTSSKDITKSDMLLKCDELKSNIEILEKDNKELDNEIVKILENDSFKNYKSQNLEYFHTTKVKLNSLIKQNTPKINKLPKVEKDEELENLKKELKSLEEKLQNLAIEKTEYLKDIEEFNIQYNIHLGDIIKSILSLKKEILYKKTIKYQKIKDTYEEEIKTFDETKDTIIELKETISELEEALENIDKDDENYDEIYKAYQELQEELENLEDELYFQEQKLDETKEQLENDELFNEYEDVKSAYEEFENEYEHIKDNQKDTIKLNDDEKVEIKKLYKKAARLCHPDIVSDELKEKAHEIMQTLNDAYSKKDIRKVKEILLNLEIGTSFEVSSNSIEDKEILKAKIEEFKKTIQELKNEIEEIKSDDTFVTISSLDDWDEYFEELKNELKAEQEKMEIEAQEILEEKNKIENSDLRQSDINQKEINSLKINLTSSMYLNHSNELMIRNNLFLGILTNPTLEIKHEKTNSHDDLEIKVLCNNTFIGYVLKLDKKDLIEDYCFNNGQLKAIEVIFKDGSLQLVQNIDTIEFDENKESIKLNEIDKDELIKFIRNWITSKISEQCNIDIINDVVALQRISYVSNDVYDDLLNNNKSSVNLPFIIKDLNGIPINFIKENITFESLKFKKDNKLKPEKNTPKEFSNKIFAENSDYSKHIQSIENIKFEKIRKYCENLSRDNSADAMQKHLGEQGKMYKALMYSSLEVLIGKEKENLNGKTITLCDWGCGQGIASMLVLDYIKEQQLDIKVSDIILIDDDEKVLSRAITQIEALAQDTIKFTAIKSNDNNISDRIKSEKNNTILNLFANDKMPVDFLDIDFDISDENYFLCVSNENKEFVDEVYVNIKDFLNVQNLSIIDGKIGKFKKYERIFKVNSNEIWMN